MKKIYYNKVENPIPYFLDENSSKFIKEDVIKTDFLYAHKKNMDIQKHH